jgi:hypothetical protein
MDIKRIIMRVGPSVTLVFLAISCSTASKETRSGDLSDSSVDIQYILGKDHYRFLAEAKGDLARANTFLDKQSLDQGVVDPSQYSDFLKKAWGFISQSPSPEQPMCKTPFTVTVKIKEEIHVARGCRGTDNGALSKLVKDGEFLLLYSKN